MSILSPYPEEDVARLLAAYRRMTRDPDLSLVVMIGSLGARSKGDDRAALNSAAQFTQEVEKSQGIETWATPLLGYPA